MAQERTEMGEKQASQEDKEEAKSKALSGVALYVAVFAVLVWLGFTIFMFTNTDADEVTWARQAWIFGSVEAVSFAAAGALFGTAVQRERAEKADKRADEAEEVAEENRDEATKGRAFAANVQAEDKARQRRGDQGIAPMSVDEEGPDDSPFRRHAELARSLFGDLV